MAALLPLCVALLGSVAASAEQLAPGVAAPPGRWNPWSGLTVPGPLFAVATRAVDDAWAVGAGGGVYHYDGQSWSAVNSMVSVALESVYPLAADEALVVGLALPDNQPAILNCTPAACTLDGTVPAVGSLDSIWAVSPADYWAVGGGGLPGAESGTILHFSGGAWSGNLATGTAAAVRFHNVQMLSANEGWAVGESPTVDGPGTIMHYSGGAGWQEVNPNISFSGALHGLWFISPTEGWVVGGTLSADPVILHYQASGNPQWTRETVTSLGAPETLLEYVNMQPDGSGYAAGDNGQILYRDRALGTWQSVYTDPRPPQAPLYGVWLAPGGGLGWAVGGVDGSNSGILAGFSPPVAAWLPLFGR